MVIFGKSKKWRWAGLLLAPAAAAAAVPLLAFSSAAAWAGQPVPSQIPGVAALRAVSCPETGVCAAVGQYVMVDEGPGWQRVDKIAGDDGQTDLRGVACTAPLRCWAVGSSGLTGDSGVIVEGSGARWRVADRLGPSDLTGVACTTAVSCWAVGTTTVRRSDLTEALIEHWDGVRWTPSAAPAPQGALDAVTCDGADDCWAVGTVGVVFSTPVETLAEHWDGRRWAVVATPRSRADSGYPTFESVACTSATSCWAAGALQDQGVDTYSATGLLERWDGRRWSAVALPAGAGSPELQSVTCRTAGDCWAFGDTYRWFNGDRSGRAVVLHWDGRAWSVASGPPGDAVAATFDPVGRLVAAGGGIWWRDRPSS